MNRRGREIIADESGANLVEYIILVGVIALIAIAGFTFFGEEVEKKIRGQGASVGGINSEIGGQQGPNTK